MPGQHAFPRIERLTRGRDYLRVYAEGDKYVGRAFICYVVHTKGEGRRYGMAVSRKVGRAVVRNRIKRYLREIYRAHRPALVEEFHLVVVARPACVALSYAECEDAVRRLFRKGSVLSG